MSQLHNLQLLKHLYRFKNAPSLM